MSFAHSFFHRCRVFPFPISRDIFDLNSVYWTEKARAKRSETNYRFLGSCQVGLVWDAQVSMPATRELLIPFTPVKGEYCFLIQFMIFAKKSTNDFVRCLKLSLGSVLFFFNLHENEMWSWCPCIVIKPNRLSSFFVDGNWFSLGTWSMHCHCEKIT